MPGPMSDSFDPEFGTGSNAHDVEQAIREIVDTIASRLGERKNIVDVVHGPSGGTVKVFWSERDCRVIRFALERALESI